MTDPDRLPTGDPAELLMLAGEVKTRFQGLGLSLAVAESCTGGGLASALTDVSGSSSYFLGGIVAYSNKVKERLLGVDPDVLAEHGAVSEPVAIAMAGGARYALRSDVGVGITGVAGPEGGTADKPVGLVYIGMASISRRFARRYLWTGDRLDNKRRSIAAALALLLEYTEGPLP